MHDVPAQKHSQVQLDLSSWEDSQPDDHILLERRWHSSILDVLSFRGAASDTNRYLVFAEVGVNFLWNGEQFKYLGATLTDQNYEDIKSRVKSGDACYH